MVLIMAGDVANGGIKFLSYEVLGSLCATVAFVAIAWGSLSSAQEIQGAEITALKQEQKTIREVVNEIKVSVATIEEHQNGQKEASDQAIQERRRIEDKLDKLNEYLLEQR